MKHIITIQLKIPIPTAPLVSTAQMIFSSWLPLDEKEFIFIKENDISVKFFFKNTGYSEKDLPMHINVLVHHINAEVKVTNIAQDIVDYIQDKNSVPNEKWQQLSKEYLKLGETVYTFTIKNLNRIISYVRNVKGQYWIEEYPLNCDRLSSVFIEFKAQTWIDNKGPIRWDPSKVHIIRATSIEKNRYITSQDWLKIGKFIQTKERPPLVKTLLANAEEMAARGHRRNALVEGVTALEAAIVGFSNRFSNVRWSERFGNRIPVSSFKEHIEKLGLIKTMVYLIPLLFTEDEIPLDVLKICQAAIQVRNLIVHQGQRDVDVKKTWEFLRAIRKFCGILEQLII